MSKQTLAALDDAIRAHIASEAEEHAPGQDVVTHWTLVVGVLADDGEHEEGGGSPFWVESAPGQPTYVSAGLMWTALTDTEGGPDQ